MKTQIQLKTLIAVAAAGLMLTGVSATAQTYQQDRHDSRTQPRYDDRNDTRYNSEKLRYDRAIVQQVNDLRAQIGSSTRSHQISRREAARFEDRLDTIIDLKRRYARSDMGLNRSEYNEVTVKLSDLAADIRQGGPRRR